MSDAIEEIPIAHLELALDEGWIADWLVSGPLAASVSDTTRFAGSSFRSRLVREMHQAESGITQPPAERAAFELLRGDEAPVRLHWQVVNTAEDHLVHWSGHYPTCHHLTVWAYAQLVVPHTLETPLHLITPTPTDLWLNGELALHHTHFADATPEPVTATVKLAEGTNELLVRLVTVALGPCPLFLGLQIPAARTAGWRVALPTALEPVVRRGRLTAAMNAAYLTRDLYGGEDTIILQWSDALRHVDALDVRLQTPDGRIYAEALPTVQKGSKVNFGAANRFPDGEYELLLLPQPEEYYIQEMRVQRRLPLQIANAKVSPVYYGTWEGRRQEALQAAAARQDIYAEVAKLALGRWEAWRQEAVEAAIHEVNARSADSNRTLLALIGLVMRHGDDERFPQDLEWTLGEAILRARFVAATPGLDALDYADPGHQIIWHTAELLAGQCYAERTFGESQTSGAWHMAQGERKVLAWLHTTAAQGWSRWHSPAAYADAFWALSHLVDLAQSDSVAEMAAVVLDKLCFALALNSFRGNLAASRGASVTAWLQSGRLGPLVGVCRLLWGQGAFNADQRAVVGLAAAAAYTLPEIVAAVALDQSQEAWIAETHGSGEEPVHTTTYRTPDYALAAARVASPGAAGSAEHLWQATLGLDAVVFVTHPATSSASDAECPNFWRGNRQLPRIGHWHDALLTLYHADADQQLSFTHAYFPTAAFDEYLLRDGWAFARRGSGYLALTAANGLELITHGRTAYRELRSPGIDNAWLCQMGRAAYDQSFAAFVERVLAQEIALSPTQVRYRALRGELLEMGWEMPFAVDGTPPLTADATHIHSPYGSMALGATHLDIHFQENIMRLDFGDASE